MVRHCQVCKKPDYLSPSVSFHKFPTDSERRKMWLSLLGWEEDHSGIKHLYVCSNHFDPSDIMTNRNGSKYLKADANPLPSHSAFQFISDSSDSSAHSSVFNSPPKRPGNTEVRPVIEEIEYPIEPGIPSSSSSTATASETKDEILKLSLIEQNPQNLRNKRKRCYIGDMSSSDFSTPEKRRKNLGIIKKTVGNQRRRIHNLNTTVRRLRLRITSLRSLITYLKEKCLISESSESAITASMSGTAGDLFKRFLKGPTKQKYDPSLRSFAFNTIILFSKGV